MPGLGARSGACAVTGRCDLGLAFSSLRWGCSGHSCRVPVSSLGILECGLE